MAGQKTCPAINPGGERIEDYLPLLKLIKYKEFVIFWLIFTIIYWSFKNWVKYQIRRS